MLKTVKDIAHLNFRAIKIHILYILKGTTLAKIYEGKPFEIISREKYIETVVKQLELIKAVIIVERLMGNPMKSDLIVPSQTLNKTTILNDIDKLYLSTEN